jgi:hypothetical protein
MPKAVLPETADPLPGKRIRVWSLTAIKKVWFAKSSLSINIERMAVTADIYSCPVPCLVVGYVLV